MCTNSVLRTAIMALGVFSSTTPIALAEPPADGEPTVNSQAPTELTQQVDERTCPYKALPGSHIKVRVCTREQRGMYRLDVRMRTNEPAAIGSALASGGYAIPAPLPQVQ